VSYFRLGRRVPERSAVEPRLLAWLYGLITQTPMVRATHRRFVAGTLAQGVDRGLALDVGTGPGYVAAEVARSRPELRMVGLDLAGHMAEKAGRYAAWIGIDGRALWPQADGQRLPFPDDVFDLVFSSFAMHHWTEPLRVLNEMARVLKPGGRYYVADVCREPNLLQRLFAYASIPAISLPFGSYWGYGGYYESLRAGYTRAEAQAMLDASALPPGQVGLDSTWLVPIVTIASQPPSDPVRSNGFSRALYGRSADATIADSKNNTSTAHNARRGSQSAPLRGIMGIRTKRRIVIRREQAEA
jgi:ubiquinone/menaquinone biosynthesis C-methylase UbiE